MLLPKTFTLSAMEVMARSVYLAAWTVSPPSELMSDAEELVACSMYVLASIPAVLKASEAFAIIRRWASSSWEYLPLASPTDFPTLAAYS